MMKDDLAIHAEGIDKSRVIHAFGQEAHVLVSSEETGDAFCMLRFSAPSGNVMGRLLSHSSSRPFYLRT
jgi:hypothetical protein